MPGQPPTICLRTAIPRFCNFSAWARRFDGPDPTDRNQRPFKGGNSVGLLDAAGKPLCSLSLPGRRLNVGVTGLLASPNRPGTV